MKLQIYGAADDLVELEGAIHDEFNVGYDTGAGMLTLTAAGEYLDIACRYGGQGTWTFTPIPREDDVMPEWDIRISFEEPAPTYSQLLTLVVPVDTKATFK